MRRRNFVASVLAGAVAAPTLIAQHEHDKEELSGPQANATVSFGQWKLDPPLNRFNAVAPVTANNHHLRPFEAQIKAGGAVSFVISGFHILAVYAPGTEPDDIQLALTLPIPGAPPGFPPVINDAANRLYWGLNPFSLVPAGSPPSQDRVENVTFSDPGTYLVICTFTAHFNFTEKMFGYVKVVK
jgi:plastocyanin